MTHQATKTPPQSKKYLTTHDVCEIFDITSRTLQRWEDMSPFGIPFPKPAFPVVKGRLKQYRTDDFIAFEAQCSQLKADA